MECVNCKCAVGIDAKQIPFQTGDGEIWCAQCFCFKRAPIDPLYYAPNYIPLRCNNCGLTCVDCGRGLCNQCNSRNAVPLGPRPEVAKDDLEQIVAKTKQSMEAVLGKPVDKA